MLALPLKNFYNAFTFFSKICQALLIYGNVYRNYKNIMRIAQPNESTPKESDI